MNAVVLQVRPAADALYDSEARAVVGVPHRHDGPGARAVLRSARVRRGRRRTSAGSSCTRGSIRIARSDSCPRARSSANHISRTDPELVRDYGPYLWLDPGDPRVRALTTRVVLDLVQPLRHRRRAHRRLLLSVSGGAATRPGDSVSGRCHLAPLPAQGRRKLSRDDWRRENVNLLVKGALREHSRREAVGALRHQPVRHLAAGLSGVGARARSVRRAVRRRAEVAATKAGWTTSRRSSTGPVDRPQQSYVELLHWWAEREHASGATSGPATTPGKVAFTNAQKCAPTRSSSRSASRARSPARRQRALQHEGVHAGPRQLDERLVREAYDQPALPPASPWLDDQPPGAPAIALRTDGSTGDRMVEMKSTPRARGRRRVHDAQRFRRVPRRVVRVRAARRRPRAADPAADRPGARRHAASPAHADRARGGRAGGGLGAIPVGAPRTSTESSTRSPSCASATGAHLRYVCGQSLSEKKLDLRCPARRGWAATPPGLGRARVRVRARSGPDGDPARRRGRRGAGHRRVRDPRAPAHRLRHHPGTRGAQHYLRPGLPRRPPGRSTAVWKGNIIVDPGARRPTRSRSRATC